MCDESHLRHDRIIEELETTYLAKYVYLSAFKKKIMLEIKCIFQMFLLHFQAKQFLGLLITNF